MSQAKSDFGSPSFLDFSYNSYSISFLVHFWFWSFIESGANFVLLVDSNFEFSIRFVGSNDDICSYRPGPVSKWSLFFGKVQMWKLQAL